MFHHIASYTEKMGEDQVKMDKFVIKNQEILSLKTVKVRTPPPMIPQAAATVAPTTRTAGVREKPTRIPGKLNSYGLLMMQQETKWPMSSSGTLL